jgi:hypothetical protein
LKVRLNVEKNLLILKMNAGVKMPYIKLKYVCCEVENGKHGKMGEICCWGLWVCIECLVTGIGYHSEAFALHAACSTIVRSFLIVRLLTVLLLIILKCLQNLVFFNSLLLGDAILYDLSPLDLAQISPNFFLLTEIG